MPSKDKGGGSRKYGQNEAKCKRYRARYDRGDTPKMRRILKALLRGMSQPGWKLTLDRERVFRSKD